MPIAKRTHCPTHIGDEYTDDEEIKEIEGYASNLRETDSALQTLVEYLQQRDKETILVFYGDHQPSMSIYSYQNETKPEAKIEESHQTPVLFWSNQRDLSEECAPIRYDSHPYEQNALAGWS